jgi:hypothetical protein
LKKTNDKLTIATNATK